MMIHQSFKVLFMVLSIALIFLLQGNLFRADVEEELYQVTERHHNSTQRGKSGQANGDKDSSPAFDNDIAQVSSINHSTAANNEKSASRTSFETTLAKLQLSDLINTQTKTLKVDVSELVDFAMIGNPKTGTTFMSAWIGGHPDLITPNFEMRAMVFNKGPGRSIELLFPFIKQKLPPKKLGYKCPADVREIGSLRNLRDYFPKTKLIVGIRHPVWWFQSFTNYRIRKGVNIPSPMKSRGPCRKENANACTYNAYFHIFLAQFGRTSLSSSAEKNLLRHYDPETLEPLPYHMNALHPPANHEIFLYDQMQIDGQKVPKVAEALREDLSAFLELDTLLPSLDIAHPRVHEDNSTALDPSHLRHRREREVVDICEPQYKALRDELILVGRDAAKWIETYFLPLPNVVVSSPDFVRQVLSTYQTDPCESEENSTRP